MKEKEGTKKGRMKKPEPSDEGKKKKSLNPETRTQWKKKGEKKKEEWRTKKGRTKKPEPNDEEKTKT